MAGIAFDFREAARGLLRHRSVMALSLTCLALGIGTSAAMLGLLDALLFRPPAHVVAPESVKRLYFTDRFGRTGPVHVERHLVRGLSGAGEGEGLLGCRQLLRDGDPGSGEASRPRRSQACWRARAILRLLGVRPLARTAVHGGGESAGSAGRRRPPRIRLLAPRFRGSGRRGRPAGGHPWTAVHAPSECSRHASREWTWRAWTCGCR